MNYACFRPHTDEFFVVELSDPTFPQEWYGNKLVVKTGATSDGDGSITSFLKGIQDSSTMPIKFFAGQWRLIYHPVFAANSIDFEDISDKEHNGISADSTQFLAYTRYKNRFDKFVDYSLVIQLSTGRFSEKYSDGADKTAAPFIENNGRCVHMPRAKSKSNSGTSN